MRILAVDLGHKRIGLAVSDERAEIAFPAGMIESRGRKKDVASLRAMIEEKGIGRAVVGLPLHMDGRRGEKAQAAQAFAQALATAAGIPVDTLDERWTSVEAERILDAGGQRADGRAAGRSRKRRAESRRAQGTVDEMAASILLRTYLEQRANAGENDAGAVSAPPDRKDEA